MDAATTDNSPMEEGDDKDARGEEEGASGGHSEGTNDGAESGKLMYNVPKKTAKKNRSTNPNEVGN